VTTTTGQILMVWMLLVSAAGRFTRKAGLKKDEGPIVSGKDVDHGNSADKCAPVVVVTAVDMAG